MTITQEQYDRIAHLFPTQRGNIPNLDMLNAFLYVAEHGCKWRGHPPRFGKWYTIYKRMNRWTRNGVLDRILKGLAQEGTINLTTEAVGIDSTIVKVHPYGTGTHKKGVHSPSGSPGVGGPPRLTWSPPTTGQR